MAADKDTVTTDPFAVPGPALFYVSTQGADGTQSVRRADHEPPGDPRERAIFRALLQHALALLDATEPVRRGGVEGRRV